MITFVQYDITNHVVKQIFLKPPEFEDSKSLGVNLKVQTMMDGSLNAYRSKSRTIFNLEFRYLTRIKAEELRDFFDVTSGVQLTYVDYNSVSWVGYMLNETLTLENEGKGRMGPGNVVRAEAFRTTIEFEVTDAHSND